MFGDWHVDVLSKDTREDAAGTGAVALSYTTRPAVAASGLTAEDLMENSNDGSLTVFEIAPEITVSWSGKETAVETVEVTWFASTSNTDEASVGRTSSAFTVNSPSKKGQRSETMEAISLLSNNGGAL